MFSRLFLILYCIIQQLSLFGVEKDGAISPNRYYGTWKIVKYSYSTGASANIKIAKGLIGKSISLEEKKAIVWDGENEIVSSKEILNPQYRIELRKTREVFTANGSVFSEKYKKELNINSETLYVLTISDAQGPLYELMMSNENLIFPSDGYFFLLEKAMKIKVILGDTVRCKYNEKTGECTGFVIQGTRKQGGKVQHVKPLNKKVPMEVDEPKKKK